jgi:adenine-specific DNA-methyltransferase
MKVKQRKKPLISFQSVEAISSPYQALCTGRSLIKGWAETLTDAHRISYGESFVYQLIKTYWMKYYPEGTFSLPKFPVSTSLPLLDDTLVNLANSLGNTASKLSVIEASYLIGAIYTVTLPEAIRTNNGVYFTPPALTNRLLDLVSNEQVEWSKVTILDPACGGGAFLAPIAVKIIASLPTDKPNDLIQHIETHVRGYELDPFASWLSQVFVEIVLSKYCILADRRVKGLIDTVDTLRKEANDKFDIIIGNPPYGKIKLDSKQRATYSESLYGHANLYGLFTHFALDHLKDNGVLAYVTPTSFLAGNYFKNLRQYIVKRVKAKSIDFPIFRNGIFHDVLQETLLTIYRKSNSEDYKGISVHEIHPEPSKPLEVNYLGTFNLPADPSSIWILPRTSSQGRVVTALQRMKCTMKDWGYEVKTGPLVWNRHKPQLRDLSTRNTYPILWAESISPEGDFYFKAEKVNHYPYFDFQPGDQWLLTDYPCILLQRTTAKEQDRRLISAILPTRFITKWKGVIVENHVNMIKPINAKPKISMALMHAFLQSKAADNAFRCISGSVAVSAYELEAMPLPSVEQMNSVQALMSRKSPRSRVENAFEILYK